LKSAIISSVLLVLLAATGSEVSAQPGGPGAERFVLTGMVVWSGKEGVAWLQEPELTRNQVVTVRIGESVGPWKLTQFLENGVELDGPSGKVLVPLQNVGGGGGGSAVAAGAPAGPAAAGPTARPSPRGDASRAATTPAPVAADPGFVWDSNRPAPNAGALGEALNQARAARAQRQAGNAQEQPRPAGSAATQPARGASSGSGAAASDPALGTGSTGTTNQVIQLPVGGGKQGFKELFGNR